MDRLAMSELTTYRWSFEEDVQNYAAMGIRSIGVWRQKLSDFGEEKGLELLKDSGLRVSSLQWAGGFTGSEGRSHKDSVEDAIEAVRVAGLLEAPSLVVYTGARGGHTHNHAKRLVKSALHEVVAAAGQHGVFLALEPMHVGCACECTFLTNIDETLELIEAVGAPQLKLVFDTYHVGQDEAVLDRLAAIAPRVALVQLADAKRPPNGEQDRCRIGEGKIPLRDITSAFAEAGYDGFYEFELLGQELETSDYNDVLAHAKQAFTKLTGIPSP